MAQKWVATAFGSLDGLTRIDSEVPAPGAGEVTIGVRAVGMNPADVKGIQFGQDPAALPLSIGYEVAGVVTAVGPDVELTVGAEVIAFRVTGGYATELTVPAADVFAKPSTLDWAAAANLFLAGATAADMLRVAAPAEGDTIVVHGASGAVGVSVLQQAKRAGVHVIGTASEQRFGVVEEFGGTAVVYGDGLEQRVRSLAPDGISAALDCVGTDEAIDVSLALVPDTGKIVSIAAFARAQTDGFQVVGGAVPESKVFRDSVRQHLVDLAAAGELVVPVAQTFAFDDARAALELLATGHPGGKLALVV
ncbi:NADPH:quinone reductase [Frondihabitans sucicola]|uniref:NADPH:quinone reductase n=1 Tax=Frondihabitans sucicola TaxID=1268041 RepID=A0ABM8GKM8_9MICO|nr:NADP-dependent oxidoreductase [Frondihabitans sucicola]BDZ48949.1 NADPH:quinone reductase [Frondihabitans sucicola]